MSWRRGAEEGDPAPPYRKKVLGLGKPVIFVFRPVRRPDTALLRGFPSG